MTNDKLKMSNEGRLFEEISGLVSKIVKMPLDKISLESNLFTDLGVDSMTGIEIFAAIDQKYNLDVPEDKLKSVQTVGDLVALVNNLI